LIKTFGKRNRIMGLPTSRALVSAAILGVLLCMMGCVSTVDFKNLNGQLTKLEETNQEMAKRMESLESDRLSHETRLIAAETLLKEERDRLDILVEMLSVSSTPGTQPQSRSGKSPRKSLPSFDPKIMWNQGLKALNQGNHAAAILRFEELAALYPGHNLADDARFMVGENYYEQKDYLRALEHYSRVITNYPNGNRFAAAALKTAFTYEYLGDVEKAKVILNELIRRFPDGEEARQAGERLLLIDGNPNGKDQK